MNKLIAGIISISLLVLTASSVTAKPKAKKTLPINNIPVEPQKIGGVITGKQYFVLNSGAKAIPDNQIFFISCNPFDCNLIEKETLKEFSSRETMTNKYTKESDVISGMHLRCMDTAKNLDYSACNKQTAEFKNRLGARPVSHLEYLRQVLDNLTKESKVVRTDFDGNYSLACPSTKCLIFSVGKSGKLEGYWFRTVDADSRFDLTNSSLILDYNNLY